MAMKSINMKWDGKDLEELRQKEDLFYRLTANIQEAPDEESEEILAEISAMSEDDLKITTRTRKRVV